MDVIRPICIDTRECFAKMRTGDRYRCDCLTRSYDVDGDCPFCKPEKEITNGKRYPRKVRIV